MHSFFACIVRLFAFARVALANLIVLLVLLGAVAALVALLAAPDRAAVADGSALLVAPEGAIVEHLGAIDPIALLAGGGEFGQTSLSRLVKSVDSAARDRRIAALVLDLSSLGAVAPAQLHVIGDALAAFRESGKKIVAKAPYYNRDQYFLASFADLVTMHPMGEVTLGGYGAYNLYYRRLFDALDINIHVYRVGTYKELVEPYTRNDMSPRAKAANQALVDSLWQRYVEQVAANRELDPAAVLVYANRYDEVLAAAGGDAAAAAHENGLVDALLIDAEVTERLRSLVGGDGTDSYRRVALDDYPPPTISPRIGDAIGVIVASGVIATGDQPRGAIGAGTMTKLLRRAREDDSIKAVVLRVDSVGGSAFASELIRQQLMRVQQQGKPVVVSMGGVAASGGYWIAATADQIWAAPTTLTGSIGIFAMVPTFEDALDQLGIRRDGVGTGPFVAALDPTGGIGDSTARALQASIEHGYQRFLEIVAGGREMTLQEVAAVADGRVWTGERALMHGLVDELGHLDDAIASAARLADMDDYKVRYLEDQLPPHQVILRTMLDELGFAARATPLGITTSALAKDLRLLNALNDPKHIYALCEACAGLR